MGAGNPGGAGLIDHAYGSATPNLPDGKAITLTISSQLLCEVLPPGPVGGGGAPLPPPYGPHTSSVKVWILLGTLVHEITHARDMISLSCPNLMPPSPRPTPVELQNDTLWRVRTEADAYGNELGFLWERWIVHSAFPLIPPPSIKMGIKAAVEEILNGLQLQHSIAAALALNLPAGSAGQAAAQIAADGLSACIGSAEDLLWDIELCQ